jgi:hypothetical protein
VRDFERQDGTKGTSNNIRCYKFEIAGQQAQQSAAHQTTLQAQSTAAQAPFPPFPPQPAEGGQADDLPF